MRFDRRYAGGEIGAERWLDETGRPFVLKQGRSAARAFAVTARLRELGYPAPRYVRVEADWALQEELPGRPLEPWRPLPDEIAAELLSLHELHAEPFPAPETPAGSWRRVVAASVLSGARSYLRLATLRDHSDDSRELLDRCQGAVRRFGDRVPEAGAIVHWDFTPDNVLVRAGQVSGVIDWEGARPGDPRFDLVTLAFYAPGTQRLERALDELDAGLRAVYQAHLCVRQAEWSLRRHDEATGERMLAYALGVASDFPAS
ncbi:MAG TPA: aminoglycoside phosphotransferase family protein [Gaiellaceae bacterium]|nr:aminoglycoside phosphotransferase family protein [Gaiellaceae bacterium]